LVALPQSPRLWQRAGFQTGTFSARNRILDLAYDQGLLEKEVYTAAITDPLPDARYSMPRLVPHLARRLCFEKDAPVVSTCSIRLDLQQRIETLVQQNVKSLSPEVNMAVLVVHHPTRNVISYVGSSDFFDASRQGQVDYIRAFRSPGSTLKPFIYGLAFDSGLLQPDTYLLDDPKRFGSYMPGNFNKGYHGMVTVRESLAMSLNTPVVLLLSQIGPQRFLGVMEEVGIKPKFADNQSSPGLSLALGGVGMTLDQLVTLYAGLPQQGQVAPLTYDPTNTSPAAQQLLSARGACQITQILTHNLSLESGQATHEIAYKTGTSYGHRDAWVIGYNGEYVVGVWIGRPDGAPFGTGTGTTSAVPVLKTIFTGLPSSKPLIPASTNSDKLSLVNTQSIDILYQQPPKMLFPVDKTVIEIFAQEQVKPLMLSAVGGKRPYTWLVDGVPFAVNVWSHKTPWLPEKSGFYQVSLIDADGHSETAAVEVQ
jgi:penicillin-binding protein 1C